VHTQPWSPNIYHAFQILSDIYRTAKTVISQGNYDLHRIRFHGDSVANEAVPLLFTLEAVAQDEGLPMSWVHDTSQYYEELIVELAEAEKTALGMCVTVQFNYQTHLINSSNYFSERAQMLAMLSQ
jgi:hypothetical protein